jgi:esterase/lipase superfamily enzyme
MRSHSFKGCAYAAVAAWALVIAGCGGPELMPTPNLYTMTDDNPFLDVPPALRTSTVDVIYATDRVPEGDPAKYGVGRSKSLAFGLTTVRIGQGVSWDDLVAASRAATRKVRLPLETVGTHELGRFPQVPGPTEVRDGRIVEAAAGVKAREAVEAQFKALLAERLALTPKKEVYVFVHGVGSTFDDAAQVLASLWHFMGRGGVPIVYAWPSGSGRDPLHEYTHDRESGEFTVYHLKQFLKVVAAAPEVRKVHILSHSRGADITVGALRELHIEMTAAGRDTREVLKLGCVIQAAADMDKEVNSQRVSGERVNRVPEQMVMYRSSKDAWLGRADWLFGSQDRIGEVGPNDLTPAWKQALLMNPQVQIVDATVAATGDMKSHFYFYQDPAASSDLILVLRDGRLPGAGHGRPLVFDQSTCIWKIEKDYPACLGDK